MIAANSTTHAGAAQGQNHSSGSCCAWCDLPLAATGTDSTEPVYCCYGCRFAHDIVQESGTEGVIRWTVIRLGLSIFFTMNLMAFTMTMWSLDVYEIDPDPFQRQLYDVFRWLSMLLALPVLLLLGGPLLQNAVTSHPRRFISADLLIVMAVIAAYMTSAAAVVLAQGPIYFEVGAMVLVMMTLGRWIEATGRQKATEALDRMLALLPDMVVRIDSASAERQVPCSEVQVGDKLHVRAGERIAMDSTLENGWTTVDEQTFTGESLPIAKSPGDELLAGTSNLDGDIVVRVTALFQQGSFGRLVDTLRRARESRSSYQRLADRTAAFFFPIVTILAAGTFAWHYSAGVAAAVQTSMSVLLIACPCALGLATPLAVWTALSVAARNHVLFRSGDAVEKLAGLNAVCLDKTGTLTTGQPGVDRAVSFNNTVDVPWGALRLLAQCSHHPFSQAVAQWIAGNAPASAGESEELEPIDVRTIPGQGLQATNGHNRTLRLGSIEFAIGQQTEMQDAVDDSTAGDLNGSVHDSGIAVAPIRTFTAQAVQTWLMQLQQTAKQENASLVIASRDSIPLVGFLVRETIRADACSALRRLMSWKLPVHILTGDRSEQAESLRRDLALPSLILAGEMRPEDKLQRLIEIRQQHGTTVMVGDGINDAPSLAAADVGIALGCGADVTRDAADVCLLSDDLGRIPWAIQLSRRTRRIIRQNLFWAFAYNTIGLAIATTGWLNPAIAAALMIISSLLVISNSLRLLRFKGPEEVQTAEPL